MIERIHRRVMSDLSVSQEKADGCELPEELRRYYLDTMGIQIWDEISPEAVPMAGQQEVAAISETSVQGKMHEHHSAEIGVLPDASNSNWQELELLVQQCTKCKLQATRTQAIFGAGNQNAQLLVIGEAPRQDEDAQGKAFVGEAGDLLTAMLKAIDLPRDEVYITNIVKCYSPEKRDPLTAEIEMCNTYLRQQIKLIQPKVIYAAGAMASQALLKSEESISLLRERQHNFEGIPLIASFHPAYLLRKPSEKRKAWQDLLQVKKLLAE